MTECTFKDLEFLFKFISLICHEEQVCNLCAIAIGLVVSARVPGVEWLVAAEDGASIAGTARVT